MHIIHTKESARFHGAAQILFVLMFSLILALVQIIICYILESV